MRPFFNILITFVLTNVAGATNWSNSNFDRSYYSSPLKLIGIYYSDDNDTLMIFWFDYIYLTTTIICLS